MEKDTYCILSDIIVTPLYKAKCSLETLNLVTTPDPILRDAAIQRFEYTLELAWKTLKRVLQKRGLEAYSPREVFRVAAADQLIQDSAIWIEFIERRNLTSHTYNESTAERVYEVIFRFKQELDTLWQKLLTLK